MTKAILVIDMPEDYMGSNIDVKLYGKTQTVHERYVNKLDHYPNMIGTKMVKKTNAKNGIEMGGTIVLMKSWEKQNERNNNV